MSDVKSNGLLKIGENWLNPRKGRVLISEPFGSDAIFRKSVVYITEHSDKLTSGFIINKPVGLNNNSFFRLISFMPFDLSFGGPVEINRILFIHTLGSQIAGSVEIADGIYFGGDYRTVIKKMESGEASRNDVRFFMGYALWHPKQLENEIKSKYWIVGNLEKDVIMDYNSDTWASAVKNLGGRYSFWQNLPSNPMWN